MFVFKKLVKVIRNIGDLEKIKGNEKFELLSIFNNINIYIKIDNFIMIDIPTANNILKFGNF